MPKVGTAIYGIKQIKENTIAALYELEHASSVFPDNTAKTCVLTAGAAINTYGAWAVIMDNLGDTLGDVIIGDIPLHITAMSVEDASIISKRYMVQMSYGSSYTMLNTVRFQGGDQPKLPAVGIERFRPLSSPAGEIIYYRMMCETALAQANVHFRYHTHGI